MALNASALLGDMVSAARGAAGQQWTEIRSAVTFELRVLSQRLVQITKLRVAGEIDNDDARLFLQMAQNNAIAAIAMATAMVGAAIKRVVDAALGAVRTAVNSAIGFVLI